MKDSCTTCKFSTGGPIQGMFCRRRPPTVLAAPAPKGMAVMSQFPPVKPEMWCGEFQVNPFLEEEKK